MTWNISSECISVVVLCIIWFYSRQRNPLPTLKNRLFQACFLTTFCATVSNIVSTLLIYDYQTVPWILIWIVTTIYFIATPLMGAAYYFYAVSVLFEEQRQAVKVILWSSIPAAVYSVFVLLNPLTKHLFNIVPDIGYVQGPFIRITYVIFYLYCFGCVLAVVVRGRQGDRSTRKILITFPFLAAMVIVVQELFPSYILSGSAATCSLLIIYLYLENKQISMDYLTGIPNRQELLKVLELKLIRQKKEPFTLMVLSLKNFKLVNNKFGQQNGDLFLQEICHYLKDTVKPHYLYRFSGDEFAILIQKSEHDHIETMMQTLLARMQQPWSIKSCSCVIQGAIGIVHYPHSTNTVEGLINGLEYSLAQAKSDKGQSYCFCAPEMLEQVKRRHDIVEILKDKLAREDFEVHYQPIFSVETGTFSLAESLMRMNQTPLGPIYPSEFIPIAEDTGLIVDITYQILDKVCKFVKRQMEKGTEFSGVSVNFSGVQFMQEALSSKVSEIIERNGVPFSKIKIEITESILADNFNVVKQFIDEMHEKGIRFGLDDFGTGYSNVSCVLSTSMDTIKLDKSLIWTTIQKPESSAMIKHMVHAFRELGMLIIAEGIETEEQRDFVIHCGCHMIQGFLYAKPMPEADAEQILGHRVSEAMGTVR